MGSFDIFSQSQFLLTTLSMLGVLFLSTLYAGRSVKIRASLWLLSFALLVDFLAAGMGYRIGIVYADGGSFISYIFVELVLYLLSMVLMALSASQFLIHGYPEKWVTGGVSGLGLFAIVFFLVVFPDGGMVENMRQIFPLAGFVYISISLWSEIRQKNKGGYILAALATSVVAGLLLARFFKMQGQFVNDMWWLSAAYYLVMSFAYLMMYVDSVKDELLKNEGQIEKNNERLQEIIKSAPFPIIISRVVDDKIILANNNAIKLFGIDGADLDQCHFRDFFADADNRRLLSERLEQERVVQDFEILVKTHGSDTPFWLLASVNIIDYNYDVVLYSAFQDITSRKTRETLLKNQATRDPLTSLYNRRYFEDEVSKQILNAKAEQQPFSVLMLDADFFKKVNDTYGHKVGDKVLIELSSTAERALRDNDIVARYGGEEFVVFLPGIGAEQARLVADRVRESIAAVVVYSDDNQPVKFTVSIGVSTSEVSDNVDMLIRTADEALYRAKQNGRNRVEIFTPDDLRHFEADGQKERKDESQNHHPALDKNNNMEISLLDGAEANLTEREKPLVDANRSVKPIVLGVDEEDL